MAKLSNGGGRTAQRIAVSVLLVAGVGAGHGGCTCAETVVRLTVTSDLQVPWELAGVNVTLRVGPGDGTGEYENSGYFDFVPDGASRLPLTVNVHRGERFSGWVEFRVEGYGRTDELLVARRAWASFVVGEVVDVAVHLERACATPAAACPSGEQCAGGGCVPIDVPPGLGCGNGVVEAGWDEECDDGNGEDTDACRSNCRIARCGDGVTWAGMEECDDANGDDADACHNDCRAARCGDGLVQVGVEECDDGNLEPTDACTAGCRTARCGDGIVRIGVEACDGDPERACTTTCGSSGTERCLDCAWECLPPVETCSGEDDDCDGRTDEGWTCAQGTNVSCTTDCGTTGTGRCTASCAIPAGIGCRPPTETCNGWDDDCDTACDDGFACCAGSVATCITSCGTTGTSTCSSTCRAGSCVPPAETCNAVDDDCDGATDEGCGATVGTPCAGAADCTLAWLTCNENWGICVVTDCTGQPDFRPCETLTAPDRSYDICVAGACVSPGCGDTACNAPGPHWPLADTGQRDCYDTVSSVVCPGTPDTAECEGTAYCGQDAQYGWDAAHAASERFTRVGGTEPLVTDNVTGLVWMGCPAGRSGDACVGTISTFTWSDALADCDGRAWGGFTDWRVPDPFELMSLPDYGSAVSPALDSAAFPRHGAGNYWSSASTPADPSLASAIQFDTGMVAVRNKTSPTSLCCVRGGGEVLAPRYSRSEPIAGDPVVADAATGLIWQGCAAGQTGASCSGTASSIAWPNALDRCQDSTWAGFSDWRLPNLNELMSIVADNRYPCWDPAVFPATPLALGWSSSTYAHDAPWVWVVSFSGGYPYYGGKSGSNHVRCVRDGP